MAGMVMDQVENSESIWKDMRKCSELFSIGRFSECTTKLNGLPTSELCTLSFTKEHNTFICNVAPVVIHFQASSRSRTRSMVSDENLSVQSDHSLRGGGDVKVRHDQSMMTLLENRNKLLTEAVCKLQGLIRRIRGLPVVESLLVLECVTVFNICYLNLLVTIKCRRINRDSYSSSLVNECLSRAYNFRHLKRNPSESLEKSTVALLRSGLPGKLQGALLFLLLIIGIEELFAWREIHNSFIELLPAIVSNNQVQLPSHLFTFPLTDGEGNNLETMKETMIYLACLTHFRRQEYKECEDVLNTKSTSIASPLLKLLQGCVWLKVGRRADCMRGLQEVARGNARPRLKAMAEAMLGECVASQGAVHSSIQYYKRALEYDFSYDHAVYAIAEQYRNISVYNAEIELLKIFVEAKQSYQTTAESSSHINNMDTLLTNLLEPRRKPSTMGAIYHISRRCFQLQMYSLAAEKYLDLLGLLTLDKPSDSELAIGQLYSPLPGISKIFTEAAQALVKSGRLQDAIAVCDQVISKYSPGSASLSVETVQENCSDQKYPGSEVLPSSSSKGSRKRIHSAEKQKAEIESDGVDGVNEDIVAFKCKAEALLHLGLLEEGLECTNKAVDLVSSRKLHLSCHDIPPQKKKVRLDSAAGEHCLGDIAHLVVDLYVLKAVLLCRLKKSKSGLVAVKCAVHLLPDNPAANLVMSIIMGDTGDDRGCYTHWCQFRNINLNRIDHFHLQKLLDTKYSKFKDEELCLPELCHEPPSEETINRMDVICLRKAKKISLQRGSLHPSR